jgi:hypothetical protein
LLKKRKNGFVAKLFIILPSNQIDLVGPIKKSMGKKIYSVDQSEKKGVII